MQYGIRLGRTLVCVGILHQGLFEQAMYHIPPSDGKRNAGAHNEDIRNATHRTQLAKCQSRRLPASGDVQGGGRMRILAFGQCQARAAKDAYLFLNWRGGESEEWRSPRPQHVRKQRPLDALEFLHLTVPFAKASRADEASWLDTRCAWQTR